MAAKWNIQFYEDPQGRVPVEKWIEGLSEQKAEAVIVALKEVLAVNGINLTSGSWLKSLGSGLYEFRIRHSASEIQAMYKAANRGLVGGAEEILLRIFVAFEGERIIVLLGAYDKGKKDKKSFQQTQIEVAPMEYLLLVVKLGQELEHLLLVELQQQPTSQQLVQVK